MAKATISKSNKTFKYNNADDIIIVKGSGNKIYTKGGKDTVTIAVSKGKNNLIDAGAGNDSITIGPKAGSGNTIIAGSGADKITVSGGTQTVDGGAGNDIITVSGRTQTVNGEAGNDTITVKGGNYHTLSGGVGSDKYIINSAMTKGTLITIDQSVYKKKDADILQLSKVSKNDVKFGLTNGTLSIKHKNGGGIVVTGYDKNKLSKIQFKDGTVTAATVKTSSKKTKATSVTWGTGKKVTIDAKKIVSELQVTGHKAGDFVASLNGKGQLVLREKNKGTGTLTINNWKNNTVSKLVFKVGNYSRTFTADEFKNRTYIPVTLKDKQTYSGGLNEHQEFLVNFSEKTNITINSTSNTMDRIRFTNAGGWSNEHENIYRNGTDLIIGNWDPVKKEKANGQITIKNFMQGSVRQVEFSNQTYYLVTKSGTYTGSDTYSDRFMIMDWSKTGTDPNVGDWNVTIDGMRGNDWIDLRMLPANRQYSSLYGAVDGQDMVLTHYYSPTPNTYDVKFGALRLKNFFNADGTVNTANGYLNVRINREFYQGDFDDNTFDGPVWDRITGSSNKYTQTEKDYRKVYLNAGTAKADTVDLGSLQKPNSNRAWLYYAGKGDDTITSHAGDMVYGGEGNDILNVQGRMSDVFGNAGNDTITVRGADGSNLDHVNIQGSKGEDIISAYGSYHFILGGSDSDEIHLYNGTGEEAHNSYAQGGKGDDTIWIHGGKNHRVNGGSDNDELYVEAGNGHKLNGQSGDDTLTIISGENCQLYGNAGNDVFAFDANYTGNNTVCDYVRGEDLIQVASQAAVVRADEDGDAILTLNGVGTMGTVRVLGAAEQQINFLDASTKNTFTL